MKQLLKDRKKVTLVLGLIIVFIAGFSFSSYRLSNFGSLIGETKIKDVESDHPVEPTPTTESPQAVSVVTEEDYVIGNLDEAEIILVEYSDLNCSFCSQFHQTMLQVVEEYGGRVAWVYRHFPVLGSRLEASAAECVGEQGGNELFWEFVELYYEDDVASTQNKQDALVELADSIGIDISECLVQERTTAFVQADSDNARAIGLQGTPSTVLIVPDTQEYELLAGAYSPEDMIDILGSYLR